MTKSLRPPLGAARPLATLAVRIRRASSGWGGGPEVVAPSERDFLGDVPTPDLGLAGIPLVQIDPLATERRSPGDTVALLPRHHLPDLPILHEPELLLPRLRREAGCQHFPAISSKYSHS